jgi:hypothetical protein
MPTRDSHKSGKDVSNHGNEQDLLSTIFVRQGANLGRDEPLESGEDGSHEPSKENYVPPSGLGSRFVKLASNGTDCI